MDEDCREAFFDDLREVLGCCKGLFDGFDSCGDTCGGNREAVEVEVAVVGDRGEVVEVEGRWKVVEGREEVAEGRGTGAEGCGEGAEVDEEAGVAEGDC